MSKWISIKDRLPEHGVPVLATENVNNPSSTWIFEIYEDDGLGWIWARNESMDDSYADDYEITHWQPLPK